MPTPTSALPDPLHDEVIAVLELDEPQRSTALRALCDRHPDHAGVLRRVVAQACDPATEPRSDPATTVPAHLGPFRVLRRLGEGGMGSVLLAERQEPRQLVAIKLAHWSTESRAVLSRFARERQSLARMNHDAIARIFDVGTAPDGRPWFAMEYVPGESITCWCDERRLPVRQRVALLLTVCSAIEHAHQKGVIHRDLKPANILVAEVGGAPVVKVIDFGLAREQAIATDEAVTPGATPTRSGAVVGTFEYMPPEQADGRGEVDTRSDVYSLGVVAYELLCGGLPFPGLRTLPLAQIEQRLRDVEPPRASARADATAAANRAVTPGALAGVLRVDLDWILMRAMAKEPARRYPGVREFADDLRRHLASLPVQARPPGLRYRLGKFARRRRVPLAAAAVVMVAGVVAGIGASAAASERAIRAIEATVAHAQIAALRGSPGEVLEYTERAERLGYPDVASLKLLRLGALDALGRFAEARSIRAELARMAPSGPSAAQLHLLRGLQLTDTDLAAAKGEFQAIVALVDQPGSGVRPEDAVFARAMLSDTIDATEAGLREVLALRWDHQPALQMIGIVLLAQGKAAEVQGFAERWRNVAPHDLNVDLLLALGAIFRGSGIDGADTGRLATAQPALASALVALGDIVRELDEYALRMAVVSFSETADKLAGRLTSSRRGLRFDVDANAKSALQMFGTALRSAQGIRRFVGGSSGVVSLRMPPALAVRYGKLNSLLGFSRVLNGPLPDIPERLIALNRADVHDHRSLEAAMKIAGFTANLPSVRFFVGLLAWADSMGRTATLRGGRPVPDGTEAEWTQRMYEEGLALIECTSITEDDMHDMLSMTFAFQPQGFTEFADDVLSRWRLRFGPTRHWRHVRAEILAIRGAKAEAAAEFQRLLAEPRMRALRPRFPGK